MSYSSHSAHSSMSSTSHTLIALGALGLSGVLAWGAAELVSAALRQVIERRRSAGQHLLHHSDRGDQYTSDPTNARHPVLHEPHRLLLR